MVLEDVRMVARDEGGPSSPPGFRARIMRITTNAGRFETPARLVARSEHAARSRIAVSRALPSPLAIDFRDLRKSDVSGLAGDNGAVGRRLARLTREFRSCTRRAVLRMSVFQPPRNALNLMSLQAKIDFADAQAKFLQENLGADVLTYPFLDLSASDYVRFVADRSRRSRSCTTAFVLDMGMNAESLAAVLRHIDGTGQPAIVPLIHRSPDRTVPQHAVLARHLDSEKMATLACQVPRAVSSGGRDVSNLHLSAARSGYDMVSVLQSRGYGSSPSLDLDRIRFFSRGTLQLDGIRDALAQSGRRLIDEFHLNEFNRGDRRHIQGMLDGLEAAALDRHRYDHLDSLARVHEALNSPLEFERMREMIRGGAAAEYISGTALLHAAPFGPPGAVRQALITNYT